MRRLTAKASSAVSLLRRSGAIGGGLCKSRAALFAHVDTLSSNLTARTLQTASRGICSSRAIQDKPADGNKLPPIGNGSSNSSSSGGGNSVEGGSGVGGEKRGSAHTVGDGADGVKHVRDSAAAKAAGTVARYSQATADAYGELERTLMERIKESSSRRFRLTLITVIVVMAWIVAVFGKMIRKALSDQTAGLALETLENESLKVQTEELAMAVVQTVLNDKEVTAHAATFLHEASSVPETQQALLKLTLHVLQHPDTLKEVATLVKKLVVQLSGDRETMENLGALLANVLQEPQVQRAAARLIAELVKDPEVVAMATELTMAVLDKPEVVNVSNPPPPTFTCILDAAIRREKTKSSL